MIIGRKSKFLPILIKKNGQHFNVYVQADKNHTVCDIFDANNERYIDLLNVVRGRQYDDQSVIDFITEELETL